MENRITQEEKEQITKWVSYLNNGHLANPNDIVNLYNKIFDGKRRKQSYTRCSSCLIRYVKEMKQELDKQELEEMKQKEDILKAIDSFFIGEPIEDDEILKAEEQQ